VCTYGVAEIQFLSLGDLVLANCEETGEVAPRRIARCAVRESDSVLHVVTQSDVAGIDTIGTAARHPIRVQGRGWVEARSLAAGDLLTASVGVRTIVLGVRDAGYRTALFDIEVEDLQACFAGNHGVCVQAFCPSRPSSVRRRWPALP